MKSLFFYSSIILALFNALPLVSQVVQPSWTKAYTNQLAGSELIAKSMIQDAEGNLYMVGSVINDETDNDLMLIGLKANGDTIFYAEYHIPEALVSVDEALGLCFDKQDNIIVAGNKLGSQGILLKYSKLGQLLWSFQIKEEDKALEITTLGVDNENNIVVTVSVNGNTIDFRRISTLGSQSSISLSSWMEDGSNYSIDYKNNSIIIYDGYNIKVLDFEGHLKWEDKYLFNHNLGFQPQLLVDTNGDLFLCSFQYDTTKSMYYSEVLKYSALGQVLWHTKNYIDAADYFLSIICRLDHKGGVVIGHQRKIVNQWSVLFAHTNSAGDVDAQFVCPLSWGNCMELHDFSVDSNLNIYCFTLNANDLLYDNPSIRKTEIACYSLTGELLWSNNLDVKANETSMPVQLLLGHSNEVLAVRSDSYKRVESSYILTDKELTFTKINPDGTEAFSTRLKDKGYSVSSPFGVKHTPDNQFITAGVEGVFGSSQLFVFKDAIDGSRTWECRVKQKDNLAFSIVDFGVLSDNSVRVILSVWDPAHGYHYEMVSISANGTEQLVKALTFDTFATIQFSGDSYWMSYWNNSVHYLTRYNQDDTPAWTITINEESSLQNGQLGLVDTFGCAYITAVGRISKIDGNGALLWRQNALISSVSLKLSVDKANNLFIWFPAEEIWYNRRYYFSKISENGNYMWTANCDSVSSVVNVVHQQDGSVGIFTTAETVSNTKGNSSFIKIDNSGVILEKKILGISIDRLSQSSVYDKGTSPYMYAIDQNAIYKFNADGVFCGTVPYYGYITNLSFQIKNIAFSDNQEVVLVAGFNSTKWSVTLNSQFDGNKMDGSQNVAPFFTSKPVTEYNQNYGYYYFSKVVDANQDPVLYQLEDASHIFALDQSSGILSSSNGTLQRGYYPLSIIASDPSGAKAEQSFILKVGPDHSPQFYDIPDSYARAGSHYAYKADVMDEDRDVVYYSLSNDSPRWLSIDSITGQISGVPPLSIEQSMVSVTIIAKEPLFSHIISQTYDLYIDTHNISPIVLSATNTTAELFEPYQYEIEYNDAENDVCSVTINQLPSWLKFDETKGSFSGIPTKEDFKSNNNELIFSVSDEFGGIVEHTVHLEILNSKNHPPHFVSAPIIQSYPNFLYQYSLNAMDIDGDEISYSLVNAPNYFVLSSDSIIWGYPIQTGYFDIVAQVVDSYGATAIQSFKLHVTPLPADTIDNGYNYTLNLNPVSKVLTLTIPAIFGNVEVTVVNELNEVLLTAKVEQGVEPSIVTIETINWKKGDYFVIVQSESKQSIQKVEID